jgi:hypothetical protein
MTDKWQTRHLVREGAPHGQGSNFQTRRNIWSWAPVGARHQDWQTDWLTDWRQLQCDSDSDTRPYSDSVQFSESRPRPQAGLEPANAMFQWSVRAWTRGLCDPASCNQETPLQIWPCLSKRECVEPNATEEGKKHGLRNVTLFAVRPVLKSGQVGSWGPVYVWVFTWTCLVLQWGWNG